LLLQGSTVKLFILASHRNITEGERAFWGLKALQGQKEELAKKTMLKSAQIQHRWRIQNLKGWSH